MQYVCVALYVRTYYGNSFNFRRDAAPPRVYLARTCRRCFLLQLSLSRGSRVVLILHLRSGFTSLEVHIMASIMDNGIREYECFKRITLLGIVDPRGSINP